MREKDIERYDIFGESPEGIPNVNVDDGMNKPTETSGMTMPNPADLINKDIQNETMEEVSQNIEQPVEPAFQNYVEPQVQNVSQVQLDQTFENQTVQMNGQPQFVQEAPVNMQQVENQSTQMNEQPVQENVTNVQPVQPEIQQVSNNVGNQEQTEKTNGYKEKSNNMFIIIVFVLLLAVIILLPTLSNLLK